MSYININWSKLDKTSKKIGGLIMLAALVGAGAWIWWINHEPKIESYEFAGQVLKYENSTASIRGNFIVKDHPEYSHKNLTREMSVILSPDTKIIKTNLHLPTVEELKATNGVYYPDKLKQEKINVDTDTFSNDVNGNDISIRVISSANILNKSKFLATQIQYIQPVYPK